jgi:two-component system chemotaxis response regulator CheY
MAVMEQYKDKKIIVVEDSEVARILTTKILKELGLKNVISPETSVESWDLIAQTTVEGSPFDLIITDLNMPDLDGMDLVLNLKSDKLSENIDIIVISAEADPKIAQRLKDLGVNAFFTKPILINDFKDLQYVIESLFEGKKVEDKIAFKLLN